MAKPSWGCGGPRGRARRGWALALVHAGGIERGGGGGAVNAPGRAVLGASLVLEAGEAGRRWCWRSLVGRRSDLKVGMQVLARSSEDGDEQSRAAAGAARPWHGKNLEGMQQVRENTREGEQRQGSPEHERAARTKQRRTEVAGDQGGAAPSPWTSNHGLFPVKRSERDERF